MSDIVELVDRLQELRVQKSEVDAQIAELQEQILTHLAESDAKTVQGTQVKVTVSTRRSWSMPKAGTAERAAFEDELRSLGLYEQASTVTAGAVGKLMKDAGLTGDARERLETFTVERESRYLRVSAG